MLRYCFSAPTTDMGYGQWIGLQLANNTGGTPVPGVPIYIDGDPDHAIDPTTVIGTEILPQGSYALNSCGPENSPSGTTGTVTLSTQPEGGQVVAVIYWNCPWGGANELMTQEVGGTWIVNVPPVPPQGAIGNVTVTFLRGV